MGVRQPGLCQWSWLGRALLQSQTPWVAGPRSFTRPPVAAPVDRLGHDGCAFREGPLLTTGSGRPQPGRRRRPPPPHRRAGSGKRRRGSSPPRCTVRRETSEQARGDTCPAGEVFQGHQGPSLLAQPRTTLPSSWQFGGISRRRDLVTLARFQWTEDGSLVLSGC